MNINSKILTIEWVDSNKLLITRGDNISCCLNLCKKFIIRKNIDEDYRQYAISIKAAEASDSFSIIFETRTDIENAFEDIFFYLRSKRKLLISDLFLVKTYAKIRRKATDEALKDFPLQFFNVIENIPNCYITEHKCQNH